MGIGVLGFNLERIISSVFASFSVTCLCSWTIFDLWIEFSILEDCVGFPHATIAVVMHVRDRIKSKICCGILWLIRLFG